jgi:hypothetical protein
MKNGRTCPGVDNVWEKDQGRRRRRSNFLQSSFYGHRVPQADARGARDGHAQGSRRRCWALTEDAHRRGPELYKNIMKNPRVANAKNGQTSPLPFTGEDRPASRAPASTSPRRRKVANDMFGRTSSTRSSTS